MLYDDMHTTALEANCISMPELIQPHQVVSEMIELNKKACDVDFDLSAQQKIFDETLLIHPVKELEITDEAVLPPRTLKILMLHGFTQSGDFFRTKTRRLQDAIVKSLSREVQQLYPGGVDFFYPNGPVRLRPSNIPGMTCSPADDGDLHGWWRALNTVDKYDELATSMDWLIDYVKGVGPIDGVIGFSQGAAMGMMLTALCEAYNKPERQSALSNQAEPMHVLPPQGPFKFAVSFCGFRGTFDYYRGFYDPMIETPTMMVVAGYDTMVSEELTGDLMESCRDVTLLHHKGGHHVPSDKRTLATVSGFVEARLAEQK